MVTKSGQDFCTKHGFVDGQLVSEDKLIMFLNTEVLSRELRTSRYKKERESTAGEKVQQTLGSNSIDGYVSAIISLYKFQHSSGHNHYTHPRGAKLQAVLDDRTRNEHVRRKAEYVDRGANTLLDGYEQREMINVVRRCWTWGQGQKRVTASSIESALRTALDFLMGHMMLLRGENRRYLQLADLFPLPLKNEGPTPCIALICVLDNGKMNKTGRIEYAGVVRNKNVFLCVISQLAFYLFYRWNIVREPVPSFQQRQQWYDFHLLRGSKITSPLSYEVQLDWTNKAFDAANVKTLKKTHTRGQGAREGEMGGVSEHQIRRAGRWNSDALTKSYLTHLPLEFVRVMAGFKPQPGDFYLPRATVEPPLSLVRSLWPWVDQWQAWFGQNWDENNVNPLGGSSYEELHLKDLSPAEEDRDDLAGQGFLRLLKELRTIILQDSVLLRREFPDHPVWKDPLFVRDDYLRFTQEVELAVADVEEPIDLRIRNVVPDIASRLDLSREDIVRTVNDHGTRNCRLLESIHGRLEDLFTGRVSITLNGPEASSSSRAGARTVVPEVVDSSTPMEGVEPSQPASQPPYEATSSAEGSRGVRTELDPSAPPPEHRMCRTISTVPDLWREWMFGWGSAPAIQALEAAYGAKWRPSQTERVFFGRRKVIIDEVHRRTVSGKPPEAAVEELELVRSRMKLSLHSLWKWLNDNRQDNF